MRIRRVVTGHDDQGRSTVVSDAVAPRFHDFASIPGMSESFVWATTEPVTLAAAAPDPTPKAESMVAIPGQTQLKIVRFPPDSVFADPSFDPDAAATEQATAQPGLAELFEPDGMHVTVTVDYALVLDGTIVLELDEGKTVELHKSDVVIQNGTRHAWRNPTDEPATVAFFVVGASRH